MQVNLSLDFKSAFKNRYCDKNGVASHMEKHRFPPTRKKATETSSMRKISNIGVSSFVRNIASYFILG